MHILWYCIIMNNNFYQLFKYSYGQYISMQFSGEELTPKRIFNYVFGLYLITLGGGIFNKIRSRLSAGKLNTLCNGPDLAYRHRGCNIHIPCNTCLDRMDPSKKGLQKKTLPSGIRRSAFRSVHKLFGIPHRIHPSGRQFHCCIDYECSFNISNCIGTVFLCSNQSDSTVR